MNGFTQNQLQHAFAMLLTAMSELTSGSGLFFSSELAAFQCISSSFLRS